MQAVATIAVLSLSASEAPEAVLEFIFHRKRRWIKDIRIKHKTKQQGDGSFSAVTVKTNLQGGVDQHVYVRLRTAGDNGKEIKSVPVQVDSSMGIIHCVQLPLGRRGSDGSFEDEAQVQFRFDLAQEPMPEMLQPQALHKQSIWKRLLHNLGTGKPSLQQAQELEQQGHASGVSVSLPQLPQHAASQAAGTPVSAKHQRAPSLARSSSDAVTSEGRSVTPKKPRLSFNALRTWLSHRNGHQGPSLAADAALAAVSAQVEAADGSTSAPMLQPHATNLAHSSLPQLPAHTPAPPLLPAPKPLPELPATTSPLTTRSAQRHETLADRQLQHSHPHPQQQQQPAPSTASTGRHSLKISPATSNMSYNPLFRLSTGSVSSCGSPAKWAGSAGWGSPRTHQRPALAVDTHQIHLDLDLMVEQEQGEQTPPSAGQQRRRQLLREWQRERAHGCVESPGSSTQQAPAAAPGPDAPAGSAGHQQGQGQQEGQDEGAGEEGREETVGPLSPELLSDVRDALAQLKRAEALAQPQQQEFAATLQGILGSASSADERICRAMLDSILIEIAPFNRGAPVGDGATFRKLITLRQPMSPRPAHAPATAGACQQQQQQPQPACTAAPVAYGSATAGVAAEPEQQQDGAPAPPRVLDLHIRYADLDQTTCGADTACTCIAVEVARWFASAPPGSQLGGSQLSELVRTGSAAWQQLAQHLDVCRLVEFRLALQQQQQGAQAVAQQQAKGRGRLNGWRSQPQQQHYCVEVLEAYSQICSSGSSSSGTTFGAFCETMAPGSVYTLTANHHTTAAAVGADGSVQFVNSLGRCLEPSCRLAHVVHFATVTNFADAYIKWNRPATAAVQVEAHQVALAPAAGGSVDVQFLMFMP